MYTPHPPIPNAQTNLSRPDLLDRLRNTNIVGLELVESNTHRHRRGPQHPSQRLLGLRHAPGGEVVDDHGVEADM
jgi:hypothetical protein